MADWGCKIGEITIRLEDLTPDAWMAIGRESETDWSDAFVAPMKDLLAARLIVRECVKVAEPDCPDPMDRANGLAKTVGELFALFEKVKDDKPTGVMSGVPFKEGAASTS